MYIIFTINSRHFLYVLYNGTQTTEIMNIFLIFFFNNNASASIMNIIDRYVVYIYCAQDDEKKP